MCSLVLNANASTTVRNERSRALINSGFEVAEAGSGAEVLSAAIGMSPDLILMNVPIGSNDSELWRRLRSCSQTKTIPLLLTCAPGSSGHQQNTQLADAWLPDPVNPDLLVPIIRTLLHLADAWLPDPVNPDLLVPIIRTLLHHGMSDGNGCGERLAGLPATEAGGTRKFPRFDHFFGEVFRPEERADRITGVERRPSDIAHDLLSPLSTIAAVTGWIIGEYGKALDENGRECLVLLQKSIDRMHSTVCALLGGR